MRKKFAESARSVPPNSVAVNGSEVRRRRDGLGLEQDELARQAGVSKKTIENWERGGARA